MKKILSTAIIFLIFILIYFLQSNFFNWFNIAGVKPNLFVILALIVGLFVGKVYGATVGIALGLLLDFFIGRNIGIYGIQLGIAGLLRRNI
ncbi:MAG: rod shape-determining protein MreD [Clostridia bacterium]